VSECLHVNVFNLLVGGNFMKYKKGISLLLVLMMSIGVLTVPVYAEQDYSFYITSFNDLKNDIETQYITDENQLSDLVLPDHLMAMGYQISGDNQSILNFEEEPYEIVLHDVNWELRDNGQNDSVRNRRSLQSSYVFVPVLTGSSIVAEGVELPEITAEVMPTIITTLMQSLGSETFIVPNSALDLVNSLLAENSDITIIGSPSYTGSLTASSKYDSLDLGTMSVGGKDTRFALPRGILVTSGDGTPPEENTESYYGAESGGPRDEDVEYYAGVTNSTDSFSLEFEFTVPEGIPAISFIFMFGSEEYPDYLDEVVDGAAIIVDGINYAKFEGDVPLKVVSEANLYPNNGLAIEYNGISAPKVINALLDKTLSEHTLKIVIADTSDAFYDTGLFISSMKTSLSETEGIIAMLLIIIYK
jgi:hypothetical protein